MNKYNLRIDPFSGLVMVDIGLWNKMKNSFSKLSIIIDTGANVTTISNDILFRAGYDIASGTTKRITTASGIEYVKQIVVEKIKLDTFEMNDVLVYAHTFPQESFSSGVLGLNVLKEFDVNIMFSKGFIELTKLI